MGVPFIAAVMTGDVAASVVKNPLVMPPPDLETSPDMLPKTIGTTALRSGSPPLETATARPSRCELAAEIARHGADGLHIPEIARAMGLPRERVFRIAVQFKLRIRSAGKGRGQR